ncbi:MAG: hypothetical protein ACRCVX_16530 [Shewanella sp.]
MAGFPQPEPKSGQFWYDGYRNLSFLSVYDPQNGGEPKIMVLILDAEDTYETVRTEMAGFVFAPTASDIILPECICCENKTDGLRIFRDWREFEDARVWIENLNHADAKGKAFLFLSNPADFDGF